MFYSLLFLPVVFAGIVPPQGESYSKAAAPLLGSGSGYLSPGTGSGPGYVALGAGSGPGYVAPGVGSGSGYPGQVPAKQKFGSYEEAGYDPSWDGAGEYKTDYKPVVPLGSGTGRDSYDPMNPEYYTQNEVIKTGDKKDCHPVERTVYMDECIPYVEKTCYTQQKEMCKDIYENNCTAVVDQFEERVCFNVTELLCRLAEKVQYEIVDETYTVQRCTRVTDRVCDTVYDLSVSTKDDFQCVDVDYQYCWAEEKIVKDRTCIFSVDHDCGKFKPKDGKGSVTCQKVPTKKCYDTPRKVREEICQPRSNKYCEKMSNEFPFPVEKQNCHSEPLKKCELEVRTRPKKAKVYNYVKECKPIAREVCDKCDKKTLRPVCEKIQKNICSYTPQETCKEENKQYCFKTEKIIIEKVCSSERVEVIEESTLYV